ncbi:hypothetical protein EG832_06855 [bacterium]|nr:hypothetical protein [bacterium]
MEFVSFGVSKFLKSRSFQLSQIRSLVSIAFMVAMLISGLVPASFAGQAHLSWDASSSPGVAGYKLLYGTSSRNYTQSLDVGNTTSYTVTGLDEGMKYYFAAAAYNTSSVQSGYSNEVAYTTPAAPPPSPIYTISASAGVGGSIAPSGSIALSQGLGQSFTITPNTGYKIAGVTVDGVSVGAVSSYTLNNVTANHTIKASFVSSSAPTGSVIFADNAGGSKYTSASGVTYLADTKFSGGTAKVSSVTVSGTTDSALYSSERFGNFSYNIPMANGNYSVTLKFAELYWQAAGKRSFDVYINGKTVISNLDLYAKVGKNKAYDVTIPVSVTTGTLNISFVKKVNNATVSGILITTR